MAMVFASSQSWMFWVAGRGAGRSALWQQLTATAAVLHIRVTYIGGGYVIVGGSEAWHTYYRLHAGTSRRALVAQP